MDGIVGKAALEEKKWSFIEHWVLSVTTQPRHFAIKKRKCLQTWQETFIIILIINRWVWLLYSSGNRFEGTHINETWMMWLRCSSRNVQFQYCSQAKRWTFPSWKSVDLLKSCRAANETWIVLSILSSLLRLVSVSHAERFVPCFFFGIFLCKIKWSSPVWNRQGDNNHYIYCRCGNSRPPKALSAVTDRNNGRVKKNGAGQ